MSSSKRARRVAGVRASAWALGLLLAASCGPREHSPEDGPDAHTPDAAAIGLFSCDQGAQHVSQCFSRAELLAMAMWGPGPRRSRPLRSEPEARGLFLANGCLPPTYVFDDCCSTARSEAESQLGGACCYQFCSQGCC